MKDLLKLRMDGLELLFEEVGENLSPREDFEQARINLRELRQHAVELINLIDRMEMGAD